MLFEYARGASSDRFKLAEFSLSDREIRIRSREADFSVSQAMGTRGHRGGPKIWDERHSAKELVEKLQRAKTKALIASGRVYDPALGDWLDNALCQQAVKPFHAIIASERRAGHDIILVAEEVDDTHVLMVAPHSWEVGRVGTDLAEAMSPLLRSARTILFVDRYFDCRLPLARKPSRPASAVVAENG